MKEVAKEVVLEAEKEPESGWTHGEWELGKRMVVEEESGEEVAVREVSLLHCCQ